MTTPTAHLDHHIVWCVDKSRSARFLADLLALAPAPPSGPFLPIRLGGGLVLDFVDADPAEIQPQHYAFRVDGATFDAALTLLRRRGLSFAADPFHRQTGVIRESGPGDRGLYVHDPDGHNIELLTSP